MKTLHLALGLAAGLAVTATAAVVNPKITTDRTVDTSSPETILRDVLKGKTTPQEKAIALFEFQRRMVYHVNADCFGDHRDFMKSYNVYGCNLCGSQATTATELARRAGCFEDQRVVSVPGHTIYELKYDGKWHTFDTMMNFYAFTDAAKKDVADLDQMKARPDIALKAVEEGRACPGYLHCGDAPTTFTGGRTKVNNYTYRPTDNLMQYALHRGESWTRHFEPQFDAPAWCQPLKGGVGPYHGCGGRDDKDSVNFALWEPYLIKKYGRVSRSYRHWATGFWEYAPDLTTDAAVKDVQAAGVAVAGGMLRPAASGAAGEFVYNLAHCPWLIVNGRLTARVAKGSPADVVRISAGPDAKNLKEVWSSKEAGEAAVDVDLFASAFQKRAWNGVVKIDLQAADPAKTGVADLHVKFGFIHNYPSAPVLLPGPNRVKVECQPEGLKDAKLALTYSWFNVQADKDGPTYVDKAASSTKIITAVPVEETITLPETKKFPKMDFIRLECK
jgi:hypothetical protein